MTYLGFAGTVGACPTVDFQISDAWVVPAEIAPQHCERLVRAAATRPRLIGGVFACHTRLDRLDRFGLSQKRSRPRKVRVGVCRRVGGWEACQFGGLGWSGTGPADRVRGVLRPHRSRRRFSARTSRRTSTRPSPPPPPRRSAALKRDSRLTPSSLCASTATPRSTRRSSALG